MNQLIDLCKVGATLVTTRAVVKVLAEGWGQAWGQAEGCGVGEALREVSPYKHPPTSVTSSI